VGLAFGVAVLAWRQRRLWLWPAAAGLVFAGWLPTILAAGAPFSHRDAGCYECGRSRVTHEVCGWLTQDDIQETEASRWAAPHLPADHVCQWSFSSHHVRSTWFGSAPIACGGFPEGAYLAWNFVYFGDQQQAEAYYREYCEIRRGRSTKTMKQHRDEANAALDALVKAKRP
jgi:hypothetical protein